MAPYSLPDPLVLSSGKPVRNADTWTKQRRSELIKIYETEIYGRVPANVPKVTWEVGEIDREWRNGRQFAKSSSHMLARLLRVLTNGDSTFGCTRLQRRRSA